MKYKLRFRTDKFEGIYQVYKPFFNGVKELGGTVSQNDGIIEFPDSIDNDTISKLVKPYHDYIQLTAFD